MSINDNIGGPKIVNSDDNNQKTLELNSQALSAQIQIQNETGGSYHWYSEITYDQKVNHWLWLSPPWGEIAGQPIDITVKANPQIVTKGTTYVAHLYLRWTGPDVPPLGELTVKFTS